MPWPSSTPLVPIEEIGLILLGYVAVIALIVAAGVWAVAGFLD